MIIDPDPLVDPADIRHKRSSTSSNLSSAQIQDLRRRLGSHPAGNDDELVSIGLLDVAAAAADPVLQGVGHLPPTGVVLEGDADTFGSTLLGTVAAN